ncbi:MAG: CRISPR-associated endonuclease Cas1 [Roseiflexaceae bacterium]
MPTLYLVEQGAEVGCQGDQLIIRRGEEILTKVPIIKIDDVVIFGNVALTTPAIKRLLDEGIEVTFLTIHGRYHGRLVGAATPHAALRRAQYQRSENPMWVLRHARAHVVGKLRNQRALLQRFARNRQEVATGVLEAADALAQHLDRLPRTTTVGGLLGFEGSATARYFAGFRALLGPEWRFSARARRPPPDPINALLSFGYTLLSHKAFGAVQMAGLDPYQGFLHAVDYRRPALALDLVEEFRPLIVDSLVLRICGDGRITHEDFQESDDGPGMLLKDDARRRFVSFFDERLRTEVTHPDGADGRPGKVTYLRCIQLQARQIARAIQRNTDYEPFAAR